MVLDTKKIKASLLKKGFEIAKNKSKDHVWFELNYNGKLILHTKLSHSHKEISAPLIKKMSEQCGLDKNDFKDLVDCPLSKERYIEILKSINYID